VLRSVDRIDWTLRKAMASGEIDWPADDLGPGAATSTLSSPSHGKVGVAPWIAEEIFASTTLAFDEFGKELVRLNDEDAEAFGSRLFAPFRDTSIAWSVYRDWSAFWDWIKQNYPPIAVRVWGTPGVVVTGVAHCDALFLRPAEASVRIDASGRSELCFVPEWREDVLLALEVPRRVALRIEVGLPGIEQGQVLQASTTIQPAHVAQIGLPLTLPIAMQINESHPWIDGLLKEAKRTGIVRSLGDFASSSRESQVRQIFAIWKVFRDRGIAYSNIASADTSTAGQRVRRLHDCLTNEQANCLDGVAAFASVYRALGFEPHIVKVPGHTFLVVPLNAPPPGPSDGLPDLLAVETTVIGREYDAVEVAEIGLLDALEERLTLDAQLAADWRTFEMACAIGQFEFEEANDERTLRIVPLGLLRSCGVQPIPALASRIGSLPAAPPLEDVVRERLVADAQEDVVEASARR
jgi:hypothetical protein